jgi:hypothetical protein
VRELPVIALSLVSIGAAGGAFAAIAGGQTPAPGAGAAPASTPSGPSLSTSAACYLENRAVALQGSGFPAGSSFTVSLDGAAKGGGTVASDGSFGGSLPSGTLAASADHMRHTVAVSDGAISLSTTFLVTTFGAGFAPSSGNPASLRVRFSVFGFGLGAGTSSTRPPFHVYLHYVRPNGQVGPTVELGPTHGYCGDLPRTRVRRLFPFHASSRGAWHLQFDLAPHYSRSSAPRVVRAVVVG